MIDRLHLILERDVGLFSLIQQVIAQIPWAMKQRRRPIVYFGSRCAYWTPSGYAGRHTVWEYYFEPVIPSYAVDAIPPRMIEDIAATPLNENEVYRLLGRGSLASCNFGDHRSLRGQTLKIPYRSFDPSRRCRAVAYPIFRDFVRPRDYIRKKAETFFKSNMSSHVTIGVHARGTDALRSKRRRRGSLILENYARRIDALLRTAPDARILVATDEQVALDYLMNIYGRRVIACDSIRHQGGEAVGHGPTGKIMPAYITANRGIAARNGEEAIVEFLLLTKCSYLVHNGSGLARTVLLAEPPMLHSNVHLENTSLLTLLTEPLRTKARRSVKRLLNY